MSKRYNVSDTCQWYLGNRHDGAQCGLSTVKKGIYMDEYCEYHEKAAENEEWEAEYPGWMSPIPPKSTIYEKKVYDEEA